MVKVGLVDIEFHLTKQLQKDEKMLATDFSVNKGIARNFVASVLIGIFLGLSVAVADKANCPQSPSVDAYCGNPKTLPFSVSGEAELVQDFVGFIAEWERKSETYRNVLNQLRVASQCGGSLDYHIRLEPRWGAIQSIVDFNRSFVGRLKQDPSGRLPNSLIPPKPTTLVADFELRESNKSTIDTDSAIVEVPLYRMEMVIEWNKFQKLPDLIFERGKAHADDKNHPWAPTKQHFIVHELVEFLRYSEIGWRHASDPRKSWLDYRPDAHSLGIVAENCLRSEFGQSDLRADYSKEEGGEAGIFRAVIGEHVEQHSYDTHEDEKGLFTTLRIDYDP